VRIIISKLLVRVQLSLRAGCDAVVSVSVLGTESRVFESRHPEKTVKEMISAFFYLFTGVGLMSAIMVIWARNSVHSVLYLVLVFCNAAGLLLLLEVDFLAMIFLVVYVGAIAVLFLFVVMMLAPRVEGSSSLRLGIFASGLGASLIGGVFYQAQRGDNRGVIENKREYSIDTMTGIESLGQVLYTYYFYYFFIAGFVLLVAMIGAIVLTLPRKRGGKVLKQEVYEQLGRDEKRAVFLIEERK
jgi:NADH-quinone oxidoreductase subunit J